MSDSERSPPPVWIFNPVSALISLDQTETASIRRTRPRPDPPDAATAAASVVALGQRRWGRSPYTVCRS